MRLALTGATGFVGAAALDSLSHHEVVASTRGESPVGGNVQWVRGDLADPVVVRELVDGCDVVVHTAGLVRSRDRGALERTNVGVVRELAAVLGEGQRLVHLSSGGVHGLPGCEVSESSPYRPSDPYEESKVRAEEVARRLLGDRVIILRPTNILGVGHPSDPLVRFFRSVRAGRLRPPPGSWTNYVSITDVVGAIVAVAESSEAPRTVIVNEALPVMTLAGKAAAALGVAPASELPVWLARAGRTAAPTVRRIERLRRVSALFDTTRLVSEHRGWLAERDVGQHLAATLEDLVADYRSRGLL